MPRPGVQYVPAEKATRHYPGEILRGVGPYNRITAGSERREEACLAVARDFFGANFRGSLVMRECEQHDLFSSLSAVKLLGES